MSENLSGKYKKIFENNRKCLEMSGKVSENWKSSGWGSKLLGQRFWRSKVLSRGFWRSKSFGVVGFLGRGWSKGWVSKAEYENGY